MKKWKEASSLIVTVATHFGTKIKTDNVYIDIEKSNFLLLALKKKSESFPKTFVFPGGSLDSADTSSEWINLFESFNFRSNVQNNCKNLPIFKTGHSEIPRWLSLRITAIRETFEECGLLICKSFSSLKSDCFAEHFQINSIDLWRKKVIDNPYQFINLCKEFQCYPDIEALHPWNNWLTPSNLPKRFDAMFFITNLTKLEPLTPDNFEIESVEWCSPEEVLSLNEKGEIFMVNPQFYEVTRLKNFKNVKELLQHISHRTTLEYHRWMPVQIITKDGIIFLLPGDEIYPHVLDLYKSEPIKKENCLMKDLRCSKMHRIEWRGMNLKMHITNMDQDCIIPGYFYSKL